MATSDSRAAVTAESAWLLASIFHDRFKPLNTLKGLIEFEQGKFDLIVSNPPYVARGDLANLDADVRDYDPALALDGGDDGLDCYRAIAADASRLLAEGGRLIVELGAGQEPAVRTVLTDAGLAPGDAYKDLAGIPRALAACMP